MLEPAEAEGRVFEIGGPEVLTYAQMMQRASQVIKHRPLPMLAVPLLTPRLSSHWLAFVTDVDTETARNLIDSMSNEVVVTDDAITPGRAPPAARLRRRGPRGDGRTPAGHRRLGDRLTPG